MATKNSIRLKQLPVFYSLFLGRSSYFLGLPYFVSEACLATYKQSDWLSQFFPSLWNAASSNLIGSHSFSQIAGMGKAALQASQDLDKYQPLVTLPTLIKKFAI